MEALFKKSKILYFVVTLVINVLMSFAIWPLIDLFIESVIRQNEFVWTVQEHIIEPAVIMGIFTIIEVCYKIYKDSKASK